MLLKAKILKALIILLLPLIFCLLPIKPIISTSYSETVSENTNNISVIQPEQKNGNENEVQAETNHGDKFADTYLFVFFIIGGAVLGRYIARKLKQPPVLGELLIGVIMGAILYQFQAPVMTLIRHQDDVNQIIQNNLSNNETWEKTIKNTLPDEAFSIDGYGETLLSIMESPEFPEIRITVEAIFSVIKYWSIIIAVSCRFGNKHRRNGRCWRFLINCCDCRSHSSVCVRIFFTDVPDTGIAFKCLLIRRGYSLCHEYWNYSQGF